MPGENAINTKLFVANLGDALWNCRSKTADTLDRATLCRTLIPLLAQGQPVSVAQVAAAVSWSEDEVAVTLNQHMNIEYDQDGRIVGAGLTLRPTPHQLKVDGRTLYAWCALDVLMYTPLLGRPVLAESPCPATGVPVRMAVGPQQVDNIEPGTAVVSMLMPQAGPGIRQAFCNHVNFFSSWEAAASWLAEHPEASILSIQEAYTLGQQLLAQCC